MEPKTAEKTVQRVQRLLHSRWFYFIRGHLRARSCERRRRRVDVRLCLLLRPSPHVVCCLTGAGITIVTKITLLAAWLSQHLVPDGLLIESSGEQTLPEDYQPPTEAELHHNLFSNYFKTPEIRS